MPSISLKALKYLTCGVLLRALAYTAISTYTVAEGGRNILESTVIQSSQSVLMLREEAFRRAHNLSPLGTETSLVVVLAEAALSGATRLRSTLPFVVILSDEFFFFVLSTSINALALLIIDAEVSLSAASVSWTWLSPAMVISCSLSPLPSVELLSLVSVAYLATRRRIWTVLPFGLLLSVHPTYVTLAPAAWFLWSVGTIPEKKKALSVLQLSSWARMIMGGLFVCALLALQPSGLLNLAAQTLALTPGGLLRGPMKDLSFLANPRSSFQGDYYEPSLGIVWYMDAQVFSAVRSYLATLVLAQPYLLVAPLCIQFGHTQPQLLFDVSAALVLLFKPVLSLCDISIAIGLLSRHGLVVSRMRRLPEILLGVLTAATLSPLTMQLWLSRGTGNANFLFFQGLFLWIFSSLGLVEFVKTASRAN